VTRERRIVAGLDLGSTRACAVVAEALGPERGAKILGVGVARPTGVRQGQVRDIEEATRAVAAAMRDAERMAGVEVRSVVCGVAAENVAVRHSSGMGSITGEEVTAADVARVNDIAQAVSFGHDDELLHALPQEYRVDQQGGITDPVGMTGLRLEAEVFLVGAQTAMLQNLRKAVERARYRVAEFVLEPLAAADAVLTDEERELGCALVDIGGGSTTVAVFHDRKVRHVGAVGFAGMHVTSDLVHGLGVTQADAERIKERHGVAYEPLVDPGESVDLPSTAAQGTRQAPRELVAHIIHQRLHEILDRLVREELEKCGYAERLTAGLVLTGGTAQLPGIVELARETLAVPVRLGEPSRGIAGLVDSVQAPRYAVPVGLVLRGVGEAAATAPLAGALHAERLLDSVKRWLQEFF
jgi:cell division protein FtsA